MLQLTKTGVSLSLSQPNIHTSYGASNYCHFLHQSNATLTTCAFVHKNQTKYLANWPQRTKISGEQCFAIECVYAWIVERKEGKKTNKHKNQLDGLMQFTVELCTNE